MKRIIALMLALAMLCCACGDKAVPVSDVGERAVSADEAAQVILIDIGVDLALMQCVSASYEADDLAAFVKGFYGLESEAYTDCAIYQMGGTEALEVSVFRLSEQADADSVRECLEAYKLGRQGDFFGYNPEQAAIVEDSVIAISNDGRYAAVLISYDPQRAEKAFYAVLGERVPETVSTPEPTATPAPEESPEPGQEPLHSNFEPPEGWTKFDPPGIDNMNIWDASDVIAAVRSGSDEGLDKKERQLYAATVELLDEIITEGMSDLEKEWAVYSWLTLNVEYDYRHYEPGATVPRDSYKPNGPLVNGLAVCLGYATAFQFLMDILDVECITVVGAAFNSSEDHAWNMVRIDGAWYCVDATWDLSNGVAMENCCYFNVSSEWMAITDHQWDYENTPLAVSEEDGSYVGYLPAQ